MAELWDLVDERGRPTGRTVARGAPIPPGLRHRAVELWIHNSRGKILLQRRAAGRPVLPGLWALTTGCLLSGEGPEEGLLREAREELGLSLAGEDLRFLRRIVRADTIWDVYTARRDAALSSLTLQAEEVADAAWVTPGRLRDMVKAGQAVAYPEMMEMIAAVEARMAEPTSP